MPAIKSKLNNYKKKIIKKGEKPETNNAEA